MTNVKCQSHWLHKCIAGSRWPHHANVCHGCENRYVLPCASLIGPCGLGWNSDFDYDTQVCDQLTTTLCSFHEHHRSLASVRSVSLAPQLGTVFQQTFGQPTALLLLSKNSKIFCLLNFMTFNYTTLSRS